MKLRPLPLVVLLCTLFGVGLGILLVKEAPPDAPEEMSEQERSAAASPLENVPNTPDQRLTDAQQAILNDPRTLAFERRLDFQADVRNFFDHAGQLSEDQRKKRAEALETRLAQYEEDNEVSATESLMLQLALIRTTVGEESAQKQAMAELIDEYKGRSQAREAQWRAQPTPEFDAYKEKEKVIVEEVMAMENIPGEVDRNEYLRQKLMEARIEAAGNGSMD